MSTLPSQLTTYLTAFTQHYNDPIGCWNGIILGIIHPSP
jgi:hypothetical protein